MYFLFFVPVQYKQLYEIPIIATDGGGRSGFTIVKVHIGDENDNEPEFQLREYKAAIHGNLTINTTFLKVRNQIKSFKFLQFRKLKILKIKNKANFLRII